MHRPGLIGLLSVQLLALVACPNEQVNPGTSAGFTTGIGVTTAQPGTGSSSTGAASTGSDAVPTEAGMTGMIGTSGMTGMTGTSGTTGAASSVTGSESDTSSSSGTGSTGAATTGEPATLKDCFDCLCDINVGFCRKVFAGVQGMAVQGPDSMCPIVDADSQESGCVLYPPACSDAPTCECLPTMNGGCFCTELSPGNFQVVCPLP